MKARAILRWHAFKMLTNTLNVDSNKKLSVCSMQPSVRGDMRGSLHLNVLYVELRVCNIYVRLANGNNII